MGPLLFIIRKQYKNTLIQTIKKPSALIGYLIMLGFMSFNTIMVVLNDDIEIASAQTFAFLSIGLALFVMLTVLPGLYNSITKVSLPIQLPDVNFLFSGPFKPAQILLYAQINQSIVSLYITLFMLIQAPLLSSFFSMSVSQIAVLFLGWIIILLTSTPITMAIYTLCQLNKQAKVISRIIFFGGLGAIIAALVMTLINGTDLLGDALGFFTGTGYSMIPVIGWYAALLLGAINGYTAVTWLALALILIMVIISIFIVSKLSTTAFYEDAAVNADKLKVIKDAQLNGEQPLVALMKNKKKGARKVNFSFTKAGAGAIREMKRLEIKKTSYFFLNLRSLFMIVASVGLAILISQEEALDSTVYMAIPIACAYILFLASMTLKSKTFSKHYIYQIPDSNTKKMMALLHYPTLKLFLEGLIPAIIICIYTGYVSPDVIIAPLIVVAFGLELELLNIVTTNILGRIGTQLLRVYLNMFFTVLSLLPGAIVAIIVGVLGWPLTIGYVMILLTLLVTDAGFFVLAKKAFRNAEIYS